MGDIFGEAIGNVTKLAGAPGNLSPTPAVGMINLGFLVSKEMKGDLKFNRLNATSLPGGVTVPPDARRGDPTEADFTWRSYMSVVGKADVTAEIRRMVRKNKTPSAVIPLHVRIQRVVGSDGRAHVERFSIGQAVGQVTAWTTFARPQFTIEAEIVDEDGCTGLVVYFKWREEPVREEAAGCPEDARGRRGLDGRPGGRQVRHRVRQLWWRQPDRAGKERPGRAACARGAVGANPGGAGGEPASGSLPVLPASD